MLIPWLSALALISLTSAPSPRFEKAPCPPEVTAGERIDCGWLSVPENRRKPDTRAIRLPVRIFRSRSATPGEPVVFMPGGPGVSALANQKSGKGNPLVDDRDFIVVEQRGGRLAQPALECPEINALKGEIAAGRLRGQTSIDALAKAAARCRSTLTAQGIDLDGYTSDASADDLDDLRQALGIAKWNLFGLSYSARLMLTVLRKHPEGIRSLILDSPLLPEVNFDEVSAANLWRSLDAVFDGCAVDRACGAAHPNPRERFSALIAAADRRPLKLPLKVEVRGAQVVEAIYTALHDPAAIPLIPRIIEDAAAGKYDGLTRLVESNQGPSSYSWGLRLSVWCAEELPFEDPLRIAAQSSPARGLGGIDEGSASPETCRAWNVTAAAPEENTPVNGDVPTLVFSGEFDPDVPPAWSQQLVGTLADARMVTLRGRSHGASFTPCGARITTAFLRDPTAPLQVDCALRLRGADFSLSAPKP